MLEFVVSHGPLTVKTTSLAIGTGITWVNTNQHPPAPPGTEVTGQLTKYVPRAGGKVVVAVNYEAEAPASSCIGNAAKEFHFKDFQSALLISNLAEYVCGCPPTRRTASTFVIQPDGSTRHQKHAGFNLTNLTGV